MKKPAKKRTIKKKMRKVKLYIKYPDAYWQVEYSDGKNIIMANIKIDAKMLDTTRKGMPFECVLSRGILLFAKENPDYFPHKVLYVHVVKCTVYIVDKLKNGQPAHAIRYQHKFSQMVRTFDKIAPETFKARYDGVGFTLALTPARKYRQGESNVGGKGTGGSRSHKFSRGAMARAQEAGLIPVMPEDEVQPAA